MGYEQVAKRIENIRLTINHQGENKMINIFEVNETNKMIEQENLDVRTITMGISLLDCIDPDLDALNQKIYEKITTKARNLLETGDEIATEYSIPVVNKRI